jgi:cytochrome c oxidase subunit IV
MSGHSPEEVRKHIKVYVMVFLGLMVLTAATVGASYLSVGIGLGIFIALVIATVKGSLVGGYFMHLATEKKIIFASLLLTVFFFLVLLLLPTLMNIDRLGFGKG